MKAGSKFLNAVSAIALSAGVVSLSAGLAVVASASVANAALIQRIDVRGATRVGTEAVRSNLTIQPGKAFSNSDIDDSVKRLYATGYFSDVKISVSGSALVVTVNENQLVNQVVFNGNRKIKDDKLTTVVQTQPLGPYSQELIQADITRIKQAYAAIGRSEVEVTTQTAPVGPGRVNLAFVINEGDRTKIGAINFVGNHAYGDSRLAAVISTKKSNPLSFLTRKDVYNDDKLKADEEALRQFYYNHGYADFRITSSDASLNEQTNEYTVNITVDEGQRYKFSDINVESSVEGVDPTELKGLVTTSPGGVYSAREIQKSMEAIQQRVSAKGYPFARVVPRGNRDMGNGTIGVTYMVDQGERAYVERIEVKGNTRTRDYVIRREFDISEGDAFNQEVITRAKRRLEALGYFSSVNITTAQGSAPDRVIIVVNVEDQSTGSFGIGAGYSVGGDGLILEASVEEKNFLGRGQYIRIAAGAGTDDSQTYNLSFTEPYFLGYRLAVGFDLFKSSTSSNDYYDYNEQGGTLRVTAPITENLATTFRYTYKQIKYKGVDDWTTSLSQPYQDLINGSPWVVSSVSQTLTYNTLDDKNLPHEGIYATFTHEFAGLGGDSEYYKLYGKARIFKSLSDEQDIIGSLSFGAGHVMATGDNLNVFDQFQIGGKEIRGFENNGIGVRMPNRNDDSLGGTTYFTASAEASMPIPGVPQDAGFRIAVFSDAGTLYGNDVKNSGGAQGEDMAWRASVGAGIVWASPFGPLRFDYAQPILKEDYDKVQQFRFSIANQF
ncbi:MULTISPECIES: outer membrane protein assembly factor BamA [Rhizobium/Agrobacterium group]|uniref:outer membrane protein assembly factor BamA n=1 Tax=Rhizobium/Agrobacterium group TaxID=227290 RepID=UPI000B406FF1|nr:MULTISPECIES: outer membrane protein assembly factor BamA [Rhizobium/Agrobacterium group]MCF1471379.1 outer membrane protein assembly factor BamA [Allorhizobium ampelinum]MCF1483640.1 outer membrane protein assembly factor BamA [Allorhizobium ampelinum]MVA51874.1 outer membrane protein assembly factor BamA [Agrobacterium vitis]MVA70376.1 outer membrane protein assembly factor BamA [Agrobacterium vitis]NSZ42987.1 outer membrane protein assembly factor BamA [Agrobacterium vitis]